MTVSHAPGPFSCYKLFWYRYVFLIQSNIWEGAFCKISYQVSGVNYIAKNFILDVWVGFEYASALVSKEHQNQYGMEDFQ